MSLGEIYMAGKALDEHPKTAQITNIIIPRKGTVKIIIIINNYC